jgi:hypothetical protein
MNRERSQLGSDLADMCNDSSRGRRNKGQRSSDILATAAVSKFFEEILKV